MDDSDILMYFTHDEGNSVVADRFINTLKGTIYKKMINNENKSYLGYLNNTYHRPIGKKSINADYSALTEKIESNHKSPKFKSEKITFYC